MTAQAAADTPWWQNTTTQDAWTGNDGSNFDVQVTDDTESHLSRLPEPPPWSVARSTLPNGMNLVRLQTALVRSTRLLRVEEREFITSMMIRGPIKVIASPRHTHRELRSWTRFKKTKLWSLLDMTQFTRHCMRVRVVPVVRQCLPCLCINYSRNRPF